MSTTNSNHLGSTIPVNSVMTTDVESSPYDSANIAHPPGSPVGEVSGAHPTAGQGSDGEVNVWEARYSNRNFIFRGLVRMTLTIAWFALAIYTWNYGHSEMLAWTWITLAILGLYWIGLWYRMFQAHYSHYYRLTNRRLFVSTGVINRRRDMMELLRVKDVFTRQQSLLERWLELGTVVVVPNDKGLPTFYLTGVYQPKQVMDMIWHHARAERDVRSVKVENV